MPTAQDPELVREAVHTIQMLAVDAIQKANSGHPGAPMGQAALAYELWTRHLRFDPADPEWPDRDRFVLSCGHASMTLYAMLHLCGYISLDDVRAFRQWGALTPGHPEAHRTPGVEATTGLLGQGFGNAVGMAAGLKMMAARFNQHEPELVTGRVFVMASDGDLMEGISSEAGSLAGHLGVDNLVVLYDANDISIDGPLSLAMSENVGQRFEAFDWFVQTIDGHDHGQIVAALDAAVAEPARPSLIIARTHIGMGSPNKQDSEASHGAPLGPDEVQATKENIGWPLAPDFHVPERVKAHFGRRAEQGALLRQAWEKKRDAFLARGGEPAELYRQHVERTVPEGLLDELLKVAPTDQEAATRNYAGIVEQKVAELVPALVGGSADLTPSVKTTIKGAATICKGEWAGRNLHYGIREHAMGAFTNGLALSGGFLPFTSTFLVFIDYMRPAMRMAALTKLQCVFVFTHDSLYVGEDGPTHQPVEHYWAQRIIPNLDVVRPADAIECAGAWAYAARRTDGPTVMLLTRQKVPNLPRPEGFDPERMMRGAYVFDEAAGGKPDAVIIATGSELPLAVGAKPLLQKKGKRVRVVSGFCWDQFERQDQAYRESVLPPGVPRAFVEFGVTKPWRGVVGEQGLLIGWDDFGMSAPYKVIGEKLGMSPEGVAGKVEQWLDELA
ncbi:MAG: transketolase [Deltaproteobacteria bacterium]|nr:transketolase [Deltaproteobacteria bacterium]MBW2532640.1 transketolase [Deltaproteobacteria bacterium]